MAKVASSFHCIICKQKLNFPNDTQIVDFIILILQFYKIHETCEGLVQAPAPTLVKKKKRQH